MSRLEILATGIAKRKWLIIGNFGGENVGDEAMLGGALTFIADGKMSARVAVSSIDRAREIHGDETDWVSSSPIAVIRGIFGVDGIAMCGGTHMHDEFTGWRLVYHWASLTRYAAYLWIGRLLGIRVVAIGQGAGEMRRRTTRVLVWALLGACHRVTVRDPASASRLKGLCRQSKVSQGFDLAGLLTVLPRVSPRDPDRVVIAPRCTARYDRSFWLAVVDRVIENVGAPNVVLVSCENTWPANDEQFINELATAKSRYEKSDVRVVHTRADPYRLLTELQQSSTVVAGRYHGGVLGFLAGADLIVVPYESKLMALAEQLDLDATQVLTRAEDIVSMRSVRAGRQSSSVSLRKRIIQEAYICAAGLA